MRFLDENIKLKINGLSFKAYLEDSDINHNVKDQPLPFSPLSFNNDSMATRVNETAKFTFNVFSETRGECIQNYNNLLNLIQSIKPIYEVIDDQYVPDYSNVTGLVSLFFSGMPSRNEVMLHLTNFNYSFNKEIGFIEVPRSEIANYKNSEKIGFYSPQSMKLVPLAYKISMEGKVLLQFDQTVRIIGSRIKGSNTTLFQNISKAAGSNDPEYLRQFLTLYSGITGGKSLLAVSDENLPAVVGKLKDLKDKNLADANNGQFRKDIDDNGNLLSDEQSLSSDESGKSTELREKRRERYQNGVDEIKKLQ